MSKVDPCGVCGLRVRANSVLCTVCGKWIHGRCAGVKRVTGKLASDFVCKGCDGSVRVAVEQVEKLCDGVDTVREFSYLGDTLSESGGCEVAVTSRARLGWMKFRECGEILIGRRYPLMLKGAVYKSYVRPAILYGSETWSMGVNEMGILRRAERAMVRAMCGVKLVDRKRAEVLMQMVGLEEAVEQLALANSVRWFGHILRREDGHVLGRALDFEVEGCRRRGRPKRTWKKQVEKEVRRVGLKREDAFSRVRWRDGVRKIAIEVR